MAEAVVFFVVQRLRDLLIREAVYLHGVRDEVNWMQNELTRMQCFLKDADQRQEADDRVRNWVSEIRNVAYDTEDIIDTFILQKAHERRGVSASVKKYACIFNHGVHLHGIRGKIEELKKTILDISRSLDVYGIRNAVDIGEPRSTSSNERLRNLRRTSSCADKEQVVGFEDSTKILIGQLLKKEQERVVISILGMGGLGKTTLARKVFNSIDVKGRFDLYAWVCVSQEYTTVDLLQRTIKSFHKPTKEDLELMERMTEEDLEQHLYELLKRRKYLVVIDDVWHKEAWESLRRAFPDNRNGSRVIMTTRNKAVATIADEKSFVHRLRFLTREESWRLMCKKAFPDSIVAGYCPQGLEELGRELVDKCGGLPLAIVVLGGLLSRKQPHEWHGVKDQIWRHLTKDSVHVSAILALSYDELPYQLKSSFLYLSLFPEDFVINTEKLIRLWIAEGFIPQGEGVMEDVAEEYLKELVDRSMIQIAEKDLERIKACRVHDLLRDLAVKKARELKFLETYDGNMNSSSSASIIMSCRRQAIHSGNVRYVSLEHLNTHLRSLFFFNPDRELLKVEQLKFIKSKFRLLRVLDLEETRIQPSSPSGKVVRLSDAIGKLIHLKYLGFKSVDTVEFPSSIGNLRSLQTLVATGNSNWILPVEICKLSQLRHLIARTQGFLPVSTLTNLQTLKSVKFSQWVEIDTTDMINLRELEIREILLTDISTFSLYSIAHLKSLRSLTLQATKAFPPLLPLCDCPHLLKLKLDGKIENLPEEHEFPPNLTVLILVRSKLKQDPMPILENLPNLAFLDFGIDSFLGYEMFITSEGFPQLQALRFSWVHSLESLEVEEGAMPRLSTFSVEDCNDLLMVPERLRMLPVSQDW
ncbi:disease resistance protein RPP13-like [Tripterygium wilfordii]|uniref:Disease resistance protein RPP13-like n=2 Tax=Tripterygium wilfordii TaxID=458696 RepID=A0A7J7DGJ6_TRIWF|nr:disease resistance protein RPP13-like [Tripterygium wilfordii]